jgi:hypothetical protein
LTSPRPLSKEEIPGTGNGGTSWDAAAGKFTSNHNNNHHYNLNGNHNNNSKIILGLDQSSAGMS